MGVLEGFEPVSVFHYFEEISKIPHISYHEKQLSDYCVAFAKERNLECYQDDMANVIIIKEATKGYEDVEPIIIQGHLDTVGDKDPDYDLDMEKESIRLLVEGDYITADRTTLGADDGIAIAFGLALLDSKDIPHPRLEVVFTVSEEVGLEGATGIDLSMCKSHRLINIDSEEEGVITAGCAGGVRTVSRIPVTRQTKEGLLCQLKIRGLLGGHSGIEIQEGRANANILAGRFLEHFSENTEVRLNGINGGDKSNAICLECSFNLATNYEMFKAEAEAFLTKIKSEISVKEPDFSFKIEEVGKTKTAFSKSLCEKIIFLLSNTPDGVIKMSDEISGLVETSSNLGILQTNENEIFFDFSLRSNKLSQLHNLAETFVSLGKNVDAGVENGGFYPPWEYSANSKLEKIYTECYKDFFGINPKISAIHAGLECGVFASKIEGLTAISVGPQMYDVHTANERLSISSTEKFVELLINVLANIG